MSRFSVHLFRLGVSKQNGIGSHRLPGRPQAASMPHRAEMGILAHFPLNIRILLRNFRRKRSTENPGHAAPQPPPHKKITPMPDKVIRKHGVTGKIRTRAEVFYGTPDSKTACLTFHKKLPPHSEKYHVKKIFPP